MATTLDTLLGNQPVVTDGGWGTELQALGLGVGENADAWNLSHPDEVEKVARAYVDAGSQVILTNTFQANRIVLEGHGFGDKTVEINRAGAEISKRAAANQAQVFASIGPTGKMLLMGEITEEDLFEVFLEQARALAEGGADGIVIETMSDPAEAKLALRAAKETTLPVVCCLCFDSGGENDRTMMGTTPEQAAEELTAAGADVIGANCGQGIEGYVSICRRLRSATERPIWIKANAGLPQMVDNKAVYKTTPDEFAARVPDLVEAGANFVGGCCGTTPDFIRAVIRILQP